MDKFDQLRKGLAVEIEPGVKARLNNEKKALELSTGEVLDVSNNPKYYPKNEQENLAAKERIGVQKSSKGTFGEFSHQFKTQGLLGGARDWYQYATLAPEAYQRRVQAERQESERISETSPWTSGAATVASFIPDIVATKGLTAAKAAPLLTIGAAGSRLAREPAEVLGEAALAGVGGYGIDKAAGYLGRVANYIGKIQEFPAQQAAVAEKNALTQNITNRANQVRTQQHNFLQKNIKTENENRLANYTKQLDKRKNDMIVADNNLTQAKLAVEQSNKADKAIHQAQYDKIHNEYKLSQDQYQKELSDLPNLQKKAQAEYSQNVVKNAENIEKNFSKNSKFISDELNVDSFIDQNINKSGFGGTREASQAARAIKSIFPENEFIGGRELSKRYKALEDAIQRSNPEVKTILTEFKNHLADRLPVILENTVVYQKIAPLLQKSLAKDVETILGEIHFAGHGNEVFKSSLTKNALRKADAVLKHEIEPARFMQKLESGELSGEIANKILTIEDFLHDIPRSTMKKLEKEGTLPVVFQDATKKHAYFVHELQSEIQKKLAKYELKANESARKASQKLRKEVKSTLGTAAEISPIQPPSQPSYPAQFTPQPPPTASPTPLIPPRPNLLSQPTPPTPIPFSHQPKPNLPPPQGFAERSGDFLEKNLLGGNTLTNNPVAKLAGLKYLLGKSAVPLEAAYLGTKGLTSPGPAGQLARMGFQQGGILAIERLAQKYPSYNNGILGSPQDRRSLNKEIEDDQEIPLEQKAIIQSKINRGKPLQAKL